MKNKEITIGGIVYKGFEFPDKLLPCKFCGEDGQFQVIKVDMKNINRDIIKCRKCKGQAPREYWDNRQKADRAK